MNPFAGVAVKVVGGGVAATLLSLGVAGGLAQAASPSPSPSASSPSTKADARADRRLVVQAVLESEADVLGMPEGNLVADLKKGQKVSDLAKDRGMTKEQFADRLIANLRPRLEVLVDHKQITQAQADRVIDRISRGHIPFWNGIHHRKK
jgi:parvulin-like peptidyl-prolyl isomerase